MRINADGMPIYRLRITQIIGNIRNPRHLHKISISASYLWQKKFYLVKRPEKN